MRLRWPVLLLLALHALAVAAGPLASRVEAQSRRVAVDAVRGPRGSRARTLLLDSLTEAGWIVVSDREIDEARDRLGISRPSDDDWVAIARELNVVAIVDGRVSRARRSWRLTVRVRNGADGAILGDEGWGGRTASAIEGVRRSGASRLSRYLDRASAPSAAAAGASDGETPWYAGGAEGEEPEEVPEEPAEPSENERYDSFRISASGGTLFRSFSATAEVYRARRDPSVTTGETMDEQRGYQSGGIGHFELGLEAELYPGALGDQPFPFLGILVSVRNSVGLGASACRYGVSACERVAIGTNQTDVQAGARGRYRFGPSRRDFEGMLEILYGYSSFTFDTNTLMEIDRNAIIPPVEYQYVSLGGGFRYGIVPDYLNVAFRADYRVGISVGAGARSVWGRETGAPSGFLFGLDLVHEATWLFEGLFASLRFEYFQMITTFRGQVGCADMAAGCDVTSPPWLDEGLWELWPIAGTDIDDVVGGVHDAVSDHHFRWGLYIGYAFR
jgi:hypothetical protein